MIARITSRTYSNVGILKISLLHRRPPCGHKKNRKRIADFRAHCVDASSGSSKKDGIHCTSLVVSRSNARIELTIDMTATSEETLLQCTAEMIQSSLQEFVYYACTNTTTIKVLHQRSDSKFLHTNVHSTIELYSSTSFTFLDFYQFQRHHIWWWGNPLKYFGTDSTGVGEIYKCTDVSNCLAKYAMQHEEYLYKVCTNRGFFFIILKEINHNELKM